MTPAQSLNTVYSMQINSNSISEQAATAVRDMIVAGQIADGMRINEVHLARELGVSRTPLREGLGRLVTERLVETRPRRGFFVAPLSVAEFEQVYDIRPILDPAALRMAGVPSPATLHNLDRLNRKLLAATDAARAIELDNAWHMTLLRECPNRVLLEMIQMMITRTRRYEHALFRETKNVWTAGDEHERIVAALHDDDLDAACALLKQNMQSGKGPILAWLEERSGSSA